MPPFALRLIAQFALTILLVWAMTVYLPAYIVIGGGWAAIVIVAALITIMNVVIRPVLNLLTLPLKLFATVLAIIVVNGAFVWLVMQVIGRMDPALISVRIEQGITGWIVVALVLGLGHWLLRLVLR
jgi:putative membrane protein